MTLKRQTVFEVIKFYGNRDWIEKRKSIICWNPNNKQLYSLKKCVWSKNKMGVNDVSFASGRNDKDLEINKPKLGSQGEDIGLDNNYVDWG